MSIIEKHYKQWKERRPRKPTKRGKTDEEYEWELKSYERQIDTVNKLKGFRNLGDGTVACASSYRSVRVPYDNTLELREDSEGRVKRLFDSIKGQTELTFDVEDIKPMMFSLAKHIEDFDITITDKSIEFKPSEPDEINFLRWPLETNLDEPIKFTIQSTYLYDVFKLASQYKIKELQMIFTSPVRPILFKGGDMEYIVAPKRRR